MNVYGVLVSSAAPNRDPRHDTYRVESRNPVYALVKAEQRHAQQHPNHYVIASRVAYMYA